MDSRKEATVRALARDFAMFLKENRFDDAHALLSSELKRQQTPETLRHDLNRMIEYGDGPVEDVEVVMVDEMTGWADRQSHDLGWVYVAMAGSEFNEAVTVILAIEDGVPVVRDIEWGRP